MIKQFKQCAGELIEEIVIDTGLGEAEVLLWIYLNMYYYQHLDDQSYSRESFLMTFLLDHRFQEKWEAYGQIAVKHYISLETTVLDRFSFLPHGMHQLSLKELEAYYEELLQKELRSKTGTYYTPQSIVRAIVLNSITFFLKKRITPDIPLERFLEGEITSLTKGQLAEFFEVVDNIKIADIACGGGAFLRETLEILFSLKKHLLNQQNKIVDDEALLSEILHHNLLGIDLQLNSVILCRILLLMKLDLLLDRPCGSPIALQMIKGDALTGNEITALEGVMDIIVGNPPYIGERGNKALFESIKGTPFGQRYYEGKMDYFYFFIYRGWELLKPGGILGYITTNYFVTADGAKGLRSFIQNQLSLWLLVNFNEVGLFKGAKGQHNLILVASKGKDLKQPIKLICFECKKINERDLQRVLIDQRPEPEIIVSTVNQEEIFDYRGQMIIQRNAAPSQIFSRIVARNSRRLEDLFQINQGIVSGADRLSPKGAAELGIGGQEGRGIFVLTEKEITALGLSEKPYRRFLKPFYKNSDIKPYYTLTQKPRYILYIDDHQNIDQEAYPALYNHLMQYRPLLEKRREVRMGRRKWYALQWPRTQQIFEGEKIVVPQRALENTFAHVAGPWYASADVYYLTRKTTEISYSAITALLNSSLIYFWLFFRGKRKGEYLELYSTPLRAIPIPNEFHERDIERLETLIEGINQLIPSKDYERLQWEIDEVVCDVYQLDKEDRSEINSFMKGRKKIK